MLFAFIGTIWIGGIGGMIGGIMFMIESITVRRKRKTRKILKYTLYAEIGLWIIAFILKIVDIAGNIIEK